MVVSHFRGVFFGIVFGTCKVFIVFFVTVDVVAQVSSFPIKLCLNSNALSLLVICLFQDVIYIYISFKL